MPSTVQRLQAALRGTLMLDDLSVDERCALYWEFKALRQLGLHATHLGVTVKGEIGCIGMPLASEPVHMNTDAFLGYPPTTPTSAAAATIPPPDAHKRQQTTTAADVDMDGDDPGLWGSENQGNVLPPKASLEHETQTWGHAVPGVVHLNAAIPPMLSPRTSLWGLEQQSQKQEDASTEKQRNVRGRSRQPRSPPKIQHTKAPEVDGGLWTWTAETRRLGVGRGEEIPQPPTTNQPGPWTSVRDIWNRPETVREPSWASSEGSRFTDGVEAWPEEPTAAFEETLQEVDDKDNDDVQASEEKAHPALFEQGPLSPSNRIEHPWAHQRVPRAYTAALEEGRLVHIQPIAPDFPDDQLMALMQQYGDIQWQHQLDDTCRAVAFHRAKQAQHAYRGLNKAKYRGTKLNVLLPDQNQQWPDRTSSSDPSSPKRSPSRTYSWRLNEPAYPTTSKRRPPSASSVSSTGRAFCYNWNLGECLHSACPLTHACLRCRNSGHTIRDCPY